MKKVLFLLTLLGLAFSAFAQTRKDINIHIPAVMAPPAQAQFFKDNFEMETTAAGYSITNNEKDADYTLRLAVKPNMILYEDGEEEPAGPDDKQFVLEINMTRNEDGIELVAFSFPFTDVDEMYEFNLFLLYEAMANVPISKIHEDPENTRWRNRWLYVRASFDYAISFYQLNQKYLPTLALWNDDTPPQLYRMTNDDPSAPGVTVGLELQYLDWMSSEVSFNLNFSGPMRKTSFIPSIQIEQKFPIKLERHLMIEPFAAASFPLSTSDIARTFPPLGVGGGVQLGIKGGSIGALFIDVYYLYFIGDVTINNPRPDYPNPETVKYDRSVLGFGVGYKVGVVDRPAERPKAEKHRPLKAKPEKKGKTDIMKPGKAKPAQAAVEKSK